MCSFIKSDEKNVNKQMILKRCTSIQCSKTMHVDYELTDPLAAGGGPHYVIDPDTGTILARRYEQ